MCIKTIIPLAAKSSIRQFVNFNEMVAVRCTRRAPTYAYTLSACTRLLLELVLVLVLVLVLATLSGSAAPRSSID